MSNLNTNLTKVWLAQALLENTTANFKMIKTLTPQYKEEIDFTKIKTLTKELGIEEEYLAILAQRKHNMGYTPKLREQEKIHAVVKQLHTLDDKLNENATAEKNAQKKLARKTKNERGNIEKDIDQTISELDILGELRTLNNALSTSEEERRQTNQVTQQLNELGNEIQELTDAISNMQEKRATEAKNSDKKVKQLHDDFKKAHRYLELEQPVKFAHTEAELNSQKRIHHRIQQKLKDQLESVKLEREDKLKAHNTMTNYISFKTNQMNAEIEDWNKKKNTTLVEMRKTTETMEKNRNETFKNLTYYQEQLEIETKWKTDREAAIAERKRIQILQNRAAILLQRYARGFLVRNRIKKEQQSKKKGKKGKKKGKKK